MQCFASPAIYFEISSRLHKVYSRAQRSGHICIIAVQLVLKGLVVECQRVTRHIEKMKHSEILKY